MKRTKIICTMGPNSDDRELLKELAMSGMDIARFNFSHGTHSEQKERLNLLKEIRRELNLPIAALLDTKGPEIRTGILKDGKKVLLKEGQQYTLTADDVVGDTERVHITYAELCKDVTAGNRILIDDGLLELEVQAIEGADIICVVLNGGELGERKGINVPDVKINLPALTEKDKDDILFGIDQGFDFIAASFVRSAAAIAEIREILAEYKSPIKIIAKIENEEGIENLDEIISASDGIMIARGDMGVEIPMQEVPHIQKMIIRKCNAACKPVITATQMLDSMIRNPRPTRAEITDVANAVYDGTDAVMLSGETAMGKYPLESLRTMVQICESSESHLDSRQYHSRTIARENSRDISNAVSYSSVSTAYHTGAKFIVAPTLSGTTPLLLSKWRPSAPIIGLSPDVVTVRQMQLYWGVIPFVSTFSESTDELIDASLVLLKEKELISENDIIVITAGTTHASRHIKHNSRTNIMRVITVK